MSPRNASMKNWAKSRGGFPASAARRMITSSMSVKFCTKTTRFPRNSGYRLATSNAMYERAWPRWLKSYVVGPQTYIFTTPGVRGTNGSFRRVRVLDNRSAMTDANAATGPALLRPWPAVDGPLSSELQSDRPDELYMPRADVLDAEGREVRRSWPPSEAGSRRFKSQD